MGKDRAFAIAAFLLTATALALPWWQVEFRDGANTPYERDNIHPFSQSPNVRSAATIASGIAAAGAVVVLFIRLAAKSWEHEAASWRRDLRVSTGLLLVALIALFWWPAPPASFWQSATYQVGPDRYTLVTRPLLGAWCLMAGLAGSLWASLLARPTTGK